MCVREREGGVKEGASERASERERERGGGGGEKERELGVSGRRNCKRVIFHSAQCIPAVTATEVTTLFTT